MSGFWRNWMTGWGVAVALFGAVLAAGAIPAIGGPVIALFDLMNGAAPLTVDQTLRFSAGIMGSVTLGWGLTVLLLMRAADELGERGRLVWRGLTTAVLVWYLIDSALSVATGFALNAASNTVFLIAYLVPIFGSGVLREPRLALRT